MDTSVCQKGDLIMKQYETVIGLEVHVEPATSKNLLRMQNRFRRCAEHTCVPDLYRYAGISSYIK